MATTLAFVDFSDATPKVVELARQVAGSLGMDLILMHVSSTDLNAEDARFRRASSRPGVAAEIRRDHRELQLLAMECAKLGVKTSALVVRGRSLRGSPVSKMLSELKRLKPSLIVMGTHQHNCLFEAMFGSPSSQVIHKASCPILLIPSKNRSVRWPAKRPLTR
ncbi:MAG TPA: universal stress protein [Tepidisphaeraceae bacterium]|nr:universal stress protein [Tepidisphaeraceae bacterium]